MSDLKLIPYFVGKIPEDNYILDIVFGEDHGAIINLHGVVNEVAFSFVKVDGLNMYRREAYKSIDKDISSLIEKTDRVISIYEVVNGFVARNLNERSSGIYGFEQFLVVTNDKVVEIAYKDLRNYKAYTLKINDKNIVE